MFWFNFGGLKCIDLESGHPFPNTFSLGPPLISPFLSFPVLLVYGHGQPPRRNTPLLPTHPSTPFQTSTHNMGDPRKQWIFLFDICPELGSCPFLLHSGVGTEVHNQTLPHGQWEEKLVLKAVYIL